MAEKLITTGLELECAEPYADSFAKAQALGITNREDATIISKTNNGIEWITPTLVLKYDVVEGRPPELMNEDYLQGWVHDLCALAARVNQSCGLHQHLGKPINGRSVWTADEVRVWLSVGYALEAQLFRLCPLSRHGNGTCAPLHARYLPADSLLPHPAGIVLRGKRENPKRYAWMNVIETKRRGNAQLPAHFNEGPGFGTVEIRMLGATRRPSYIHAWAKLWGKIAAYIAYYPVGTVTMAALSGFLSPDLAAVAEAKANGVRDTGDQQASGTQRRPGLRVSNGQQRALDAMPDWQRAGEAVNVHVTSFDDDDAIDAD